MVESDRLEINQKRLLKRRNKLRSSYLPLPVSMMV
jgi:hypothetical protein